VDLEIGLDERRSYPTRTMRADVVVVPIACHMVNPPDAFDGPGAVPSF